MALVFIKALTASSSSSLDFVDGTSDVVFDNTYNEYQFHFVNLHPAHQAYYPAFNPSIDGGSSYGVATTTTFFKARHSENDSLASLAYVGGYDHAQDATGPIYMSEDVGSDDAEKSGSGIMTLYDPSSTTYVKHFLIKMSIETTSDQALVSYVGGYINTTSAVDAIKFQFSDGNMDAGTIYMYGVS